MRPVERDVILDFLREQWRRQVLSALITVQIALIPGSLSLSVGTPTATVSGTAKDLSGTPTGQPVYYYSSNPAVATADRVTGLVTRVGAGSATIYALVI